MPKKETETQIEAKAETREMIDYHHTLEDDISEEICHLIREVEAELQGLAHNVYVDRKPEWKVPDLIEARETLARTSYQLRRGNYCLLYGTHYTKYAYGEISEEEFDRVI
jgi:hypothetical protein